MLEHTALLEYQPIVFSLDLTPPTTHAHTHTQSLGRDKVKESSSYLSSQILCLVANDK